MASIILVASVALTVWLYNKGKNKESKTQINVDASTVQALKDKPWMSTIRRVS